MVEIPVVSLRVVKESSIVRDRAPECLQAEAVYDLLSDYKTRDRECFVVLHLNARYQVASMEMVSVGTVNHSFIHPREVFKSAIVSSAAAIILAHNHPSGDPTPSEEDLTVTQRLLEAGRLLGIGILDHLVIAQDSFVSMLAVCPSIFGR